MPLQGKGGGSGIPSVSLQHNAQPDGLIAERPRRARATPVPTRLNRALFSTHRWPWLLLDFGLVVVLYEIGIRLSPYGGYREIVSPYVALSLVYALSFGASAAVWANVDLADRVLGWRSRYGIREIVASAWAWHSREARPTSV